MKRDIDDSPKEERPESENKKSRPDLQPNLEDIGAGYSIEDRRVKEALKTYETKLLPFFDENPSLLKRSNYLSLRGYATGIENRTPTSSITHRS